MPVLHKIEDEKKYRAEVKSFVKKELGIKRLSESQLDRFCDAFTTKLYAKQHNIADFELLEFYGDKYRNYLTVCYLRDHLANADFAEGKLTKLTNFFISNKYIPEALYRSDICYVNLIRFSAVALNNYQDQKSAIAGAVYRIFESLIGVLEAMGRRDLAYRFLDKILSQDFDEIVEECGTGRETIDENGNKTYEVLNIRTSRMWDDFLKRVREYESK